MWKKVVVCLAFVASCLVAWFVTLGFAAGPEAPPRLVADPSVATAGTLHVIDRGGGPPGLCPLEHTDVDAAISGFLARTTVTQQFANPYDHPIEAVYTFPLPDMAAVDRMTMHVGERTIEGKILEKNKARKVYDAAKNAGQVASLLDQERANIFTQSVANIMPGERVRIEISYVETLSYEDGSYRFVFPMVVGPRYVPGKPSGRQGGGWSDDTDQVPDASKITPPVAAPGTRAGHDVSLRVALDAGLPIVDLSSTLHDVDVQRTSDRSAIVTLKNEAEIPNRDFILSYTVAGARIGDALLTHRDERGGFFTLILQPPDRVPAEDVAPRELVFVLDTSGSMSGFPLEKAKETMDLAFAALRPQDTFNLITFAGDTHVLFPEPVRATEANLARAQAFLKARSGGGGTEMMAAIRTALEPTDKAEHVRIVCFMTDGYVGNDMEILGELRKHPNARVFSFGVGDSVNRFLLDRMAVEGRGEVEYVTLRDDGSAAARRFAERVQNPLLTDISIDWGGLAVEEVQPARIPDVFSAKPVVVTGRYAKAGTGTITIRGTSGGRAVVRTLDVSLPERDEAHDVLATLWARRKVEALMSEDWAGAQAGAQRADIVEPITKLGLDYGLLTEYTSFVAVEEMVVNEGGQQRRVDVPVEMPSGVTMGGDKQEYDAASMQPVSKGVLSPAPTNGPAGVPGGVAGGVPTAEPPPPPEAERRAQAETAASDDTDAKVVRISGGVLAGRAIRKVDPEYPDAAKQAKVSGPVVVEVTVDETGKVIKARAVSGHPLLRDAAVAAARKWVFHPTVLAGRAVRVVGTITFTFGKK